MVSTNFGQAKDTIPISPDELDASNWLHDHGDYLFRIALLSLKSRDLAEEMVQETFLAAIRALDSFEGRSSVRTWLRTILRNKIVDYLRKSSRENTISYEESSFDDRSEYFNKLGIWNKLIPSWGKDPEAVLNEGEFFRVLEKCLGKLPDRLRRVFMLRVFDDLSTDEICKELDISSSNSWVIMYRSRMMLRTCVEKHWFGKK